MEYRLGNVRTCDVANTKYAWSLADFVVQRLRIFGTSRFRDLGFGAWDVKCAGMSSV